MQELIDVIRAAIAADATNDHKAAGVQACRTIALALDTEPGKPLVLAGAAPVQAMSRVSIDQVLDLMIARLSLIAKDREATPALPAPPAAPSTAMPPAPSRGLRVPLATGGALKVASRPSNRPAVPKVAPRIANTARSTSPRKP